MSDDATSADLPSRPRATQEAETLAAEPLPRPEGSSSSTLTQPTSPPEEGVSVPMEPEFPAIPGYKILGVLGRGGMGVVFKARHLRLDRVVALKMVLAGPHAGPEARIRFLAEAEVVARLQHPHIVQIHEIGQHDREMYFTMEFVDGGSLSSRLGLKTLPPCEAAQLLEKVARAVHFAHGRGIIHRDLKPGNILLTADGTPKITDFSLAKRLDESAELTEVGTVMGTPSYMPPEQAVGDCQAIGPASDVYALGAVLYEALTGRPPFKSASSVETILQLTKEDPVAPSRLQARLPRDLETVCLKCLEKDPAKRYPSAGALANDLARFLAHEPVQARPIRLPTRAVRWGRRHPVLAVLMTMTAAAALILIGVITVDNARLQRERDRALGQEQIASQERDHAQQSRREAEAARQAAEATTSDMDTFTGLTAADHGDAAEAVFWFASAAALAPHDPQRQNDSRIRVRTWGRHVGRPLAAFQHHGSPIRSLVFHPRLDSLLLTAQDGECTLWDWPRESPVSLPADGQEVCAAAWDPSGDWLALGTAKGEVVLRDFPAGQRVRRLAHQGRITALAFSPNGGYLAVAGRGVRVWDRRQERWATPVLEHSATVLRLVFNAAGTRLATGGKDELARVFAVPSESPAPLFAPRPSVGLARNRADGAPLVFVDADRGLLTVTGPGEVSWWSTENGKLLRTVRSPDGPTANLETLAASSDGRYFAVGGFLHGQLWHVASGRPIGRALEHRNGIPSAAFSPDGRLLLTVSGDRSAVLWSVPDGERVAMLPHQAGVFQAAYSGSSRVFATGQEDGLIRVWEFDEGNPRDYHLAGNNNCPFVLASADGRSVLVTGLEGGVAGTRVYDVASGQPAGPTLAVAGVLRGGALSPDGRHAVTLSGPPISSDGVELRLADFQPGRLQLWDWRTGVPRLVQTPTRPAAAAFSPDGRTLAAVCVDGQILVVDVATATVRARASHGAAAWSPRWVALAFAPDGQSFATAGFRGGAGVWDTATGRPRYPPLGHQGVCLDVAYSPDGRYLVTAGTDRTAQVWDAATGQPAAPPLKHPDWVFAARFRPDGRCVLTSCRDAHARVWDWGAEPSVRVSLEHRDEVFDAEFSPDGRRVFTCSRDGSLRAWDAEVGKPLTPSYPLGGPVRQVRLSADGHWAIAAAEGTDVLHVFDLGDLNDPPQPGTDTLQAWAALLSGRTLENGAVHTLDSEQWLQRWRQFRPGPAEPPAAGRPGADTLAWHRRQARLCEERLAWSSAAAHLDVLIGASPNQGLLRARRALARWEAGDLAGAAADYRDAIRLIRQACPLDPEACALESRLAYVYLQAGDRNGFRRTCTDLLAHIQPTSPPEAANQAAWACALSPGAVADPTAPLKLAERAATDGSWQYQSTAGASAYRAGRFAEAVRWLETAIRGQGQGGSGLDLLFLAMAHHRLGHDPQAHDCLVRARRTIEAAGGDAPGGIVTPYRMQAERLERRLLRREAERLVKHTAF